jgi:alkylation response protein AidB-like acyl-CoA dehydrogenase
MDDCDLVDTLDSVRRLIRERVVLLEAEIDEEDKVPDAIRKGSKDMGLLGFTLLGEHGGLGPSMEQESKLVMGLGRNFRHQQRHRRAGAHVPRRPAVPHPRGHLADRAGDHRQVATRRHRPGLRGGP